MEQFIEVTGETLSFRLIRLRGGNRSSKLVGNPVNLPCSSPEISKYEISPTPSSINKRFQFSFVLVDHTFISETEKCPADDDMVKERDIHRLKRYPYRSCDRIIFAGRLGVTRGVVVLCEVEIYVD